MDWILVSARLVVQVMRPLDRLAGLKQASRRSSLDALNFSFFFQRLLPNPNSQYIHLFTTNLTFSLQKWQPYCAVESATVSVDAANAQPKFVRLPSNCVEPVAITLDNAVKTLARSSWKAVPVAFAATLPLH